MMTDLGSAHTITFDIWDTVLRRTCHPEALKRYAAGCLIEALGLTGVSVSAVHTKRLAIEAALGQANGAGEFFLDQVVMAWVDAYAPSLSAAERASVAARLAAAEQAKELSVTYADPTTATLLRSMPRTTPPYYLSDYYCRAGHIEALLKKTGLQRVFAGGLVSCDMGTSKRQGALFDRARHVFAVDGLWLHVGDHPHSDVAQANRHGARGVLWQTAETSMLPLKARQYQARLAGGLDWGPTRSAAESPWAFGQRLAPLVAGYCRALEKVAQTRGADRILFLAREGIFVSKAFAVLSKTPYSVLDVSRRATFAASLTGGLDAGLAAMWAQYGTQSPAAFCMTLNASPAVFRPLFEAAGLAWETPIEGIATATPMVALLATSAFREALDAHLAAEREAFCGYLTAVLGELPQKGKTYIVADVGWKGTIQDNLARLFPEAHFVGLYCGLVPVKPSHANSEKYGYVVDAALQADWALYLKQTLPFELLFNAAQGSTLGYRKVSTQRRMIHGVLEDHGFAAKPDRWVPVYDELAGESAIHKSFTEHVQAGCLTALPRLMDELERQAVSDAELTELARALWLEIQGNPPKCLIEAAYALEHNESFGVGEAVTFRRDLSWKDLARAVRNADARKELRGWLERMPWRKVILRQQETSLATKVALVLFHLRERIR